jgi:hypothetical protein
MLRVAVIISVVLHFAACNSTDRQDHGTSGADCGSDCTIPCQGVDCSCIPNCTGKECGDDGCEGFCGDCSPNQNCIDGTCKADGACPEGLPCDDGNFCTSDDFCQDGLCAGQSYICDDQADCTNDVCDGTGLCQYKPKPGWCLIGAECHQEAEQEPGNPCRECLSSVDKTAWSNDDSNLCSDSDVCTLHDYCVAGTCTSTGDTLECHDDNPCTDEICLPAGGCSFVNNKAQCDDGNPCTGNDICESGTCQGKLLECNDGNPCTEDKCVVEEGCVHSIVVGACDDGNMCTIGDACDNGVCLPGTTALDCDDSNPCTSESCKPMSGCMHKNNTFNCDDDNPCTLNDKCSNGECLAGSEEPLCNDANPCTQDECVAGLGCIYAAIAAPCNDGDLCTLGDYCHEGKCVPGNDSLMCADQNTCTDDICNPLAGCKHVNNMAGCDDENECTQNDKCALGLCTGTIKACNDNNVCTTDKCVPFYKGGCVYEPNSFPCEDGDPCTMSDHCSGGTCAKGTVSLQCDDHNPCTEDFCESGVGCQHFNIVAYCDDGNPCSDGDYCNAGECTSGPNICLCKVTADCLEYDDGDLCNGTLFCDKSNPNPGKWSCTAQPGSEITCDHSQDSKCLETKCAPYSGQCVKSPVNNGETCDDGNLCTFGDSCLSGTCLGPQNVVCDDSNECTEDSCVSQFGCLYKSVKEGTPCEQPDWKCASGQCVPCKPNCLGKECGDNNCGGTCGQCQGSMVCHDGTCIDVGVVDCNGPDQSSYPSCGTIPFQGCCQDNRVYYCEAEALYCLDCTPPGLQCGWDKYNFFYDCKSSGDADPTGTYPKACLGCVPPCPPGFNCSNDICIACLPDCLGKVCGDDGCGGSCGTCAFGDVCSNGKCVPESGLQECNGPNQSSYPYCGDIESAGCCDIQGRVLWCENGSLYCQDCNQGMLECGWKEQQNMYDCLTEGEEDPDGQHPKNCAECIPACWPGYACVNGQCVPCESDCTGLECGDDGCGGNCGTCPGGKVCQAGTCESVSECGEVTPEGECQGDTVVWCQNNQLHVHDCLIDDEICTYLPDYGKYGCKFDCGVIPAEGSCDQTLLQTCSESGIQVVDCADFGTTCGWNDDLESYSCLDACGDLDYHGQCDGDVLTYCSSPYGEGGELVVVDCAQNGMVCAQINIAIGYDCVDACGGITSFGYCDGSLLHYCDASLDPPQIVVIDCAQFGKECGLEDPALGYSCIAGQGDGDMVVSGTITYDKREATPVGLGGTTKVPARRVQVTVWSNNGTPNNEADDDSLFSSYSNDEGYYILSYDDPGHDVYVAAYTWWSEGAYSQYVVIPSGSWGQDSETVGVKTQDFAPVPQIEKPIHITEQQNSGAFNIQDRLLDGRRFAEEYIGQPPTLYVEWDGQDNSVCWYGSYYDPKEQYIHIASCSDDGDEFDDSVILHEYGHHVSFSFSQDDNPGGAHWVEWDVDPRMAWSEGFATFFGQSVLGQPVYIDATDWDALVYDLEGASSMCPASSYLGMKQDLCEALVGGILWDISDADADSFDTLAMGPDEILDVLGNYLTPGDFQDRGVSGTDFVDFLDGWFCQGHQKFSDINTMVVEGGQFPYDFMGPCEKPVSPLYVSLKGTQVTDGRYLLTATVRSVRQATDITVRFHLPDGSETNGKPLESIFNLQAGEKRQVQTFVSGEMQGKRLACTASFSPHPAIKYSSAATVDLGEVPDTSIPGRSARMPDGRPARLWLVH